MECPKILAGNVTEVANFFNYSPKRQRLFEKVIDVNQTESHRQKLHDLCRTRWIERHLAYETFTELYQSIVDTLDVMLHEADNAEQYGQWCWDRESLTKANGLYHVIRSFDFLMALTVTSNALASVRPLSVKLQKKSQDIVRAYDLVKGTIEDLEAVRESEKAMDEWFEQAAILAQSVGTVPQVRRTSRRQQHRDNVEHSTLEEYSRRSITVPFLDYLVTGMKERFSGTSSQVSSLLCLVPKVMESSTDTEETFKQLGKTYASHLPNPLTLSTDVRKWKMKWEKTSAEERPASPSAALLECDPDVFPNIHTLLRIACTLPVTSAENERCNSSLKRLKTYLRSTMGASRLSSLALMSVHRSVTVDFEQIVTDFGQLHPRRLLMTDPLFDSHQ